MFVKPAPGLRIPDPDLRDMLPDGGRDVPASPYWHRRIGDKDVVAATPPTPPTPPTEQPVIADRSEE